MSTCGVHYVNMDRKTYQQRVWTQSRKMLESLAEFHGYTIPQMIHFLAKWKLESLGKVHAGLMKAIRHDARQRGRK
jgi:hypothetical protein